MKEFWEVLCFGFLVLFVVFDDEVVCGCVGDDFGVFEGCSVEYVDCVVVCE